MDNKSKPCYPVTCSYGFTLIELVAVMVILATLGAVALPRFAHNDATVPAQADQLGRAIRHAQDRLRSISSLPPATPLPMASLPHLCVTLQVRNKPIR